VKACERKLFFKVFQEVNIGSDTDTILPYRSDTY